MLPALFLLLYAAALLILRHSPAISAHWGALLAAPRLFVGAWALLLALQVRRSALPPSVAIGIVLALSAAASVVGGLWLDWRGVRLLSASAWLIVAAIGARAR